MARTAKIVNEPIVEPVEGELVTLGQGMTLPEETTKNLAKINESIAWLKRVEVEYAEIPDVETKEGMALAKSRRKELIGWIKDSNDARLAATKPLRDLTRDINDSWSETFSPPIETLKTAYDTTIKEVEQRIADEKEAKKQAEAARVDALRQRLHEMDVTAAGLHTIKAITEYLDVLESIDVTEFAEFQMTAESNIHGVKGSLIARRETLQAQAEEAERLARQKAEQDKIAAEQKAQMDKIAEQQATVAKQQAEAQEAIEAQKREIAEAKAVAEQRVIDDANARAAADELARREKAQALKAERDKQEAIETARLQAIQDEQARVEAEKQKAADAKAEADRLAAMAPDKEKLLAWVDGLPAIPKMSTQDGREMSKAMNVHIGKMFAVVKGMGVTETEAT